MVDSQKETHIISCDSDDATVCFCYRLSAKRLKDAYAECGSLAEVQKATKAGTACGGCRIALGAIFDEQPDDINQINRELHGGTACSKPGSRIMRGFIIANDKLESSVYSSNGVSPQLGNCDTTTSMKYHVLDRFGKKILAGEKLVPTNETFVFNTKDHDLPRPFYGTFVLELGRSNFGGARFNVYWTSAKGRTTTHENSSTGRPLVNLPIVFERDSLVNNNDIYFALLNPHQNTQGFTVTAFDVDSQESFSWESSLQPYQTEWLDIGGTVLAAAYKRKPKGRFAIRLGTSTLDPHGAITTFFFIHNRISDIWTSNHL